MEQQTETAGLLDRFLTPAFSVVNGSILQVNYAARCRMIVPGISINDILGEDAQAYADFTGGCLYLTLELNGQPFGASVTRQNGTDIFIMDHEVEQQQLQVLALASRELRTPLADIMSATDRLLSSLDPNEDPAARADAARINRSIHQLHRLVCNMSDASRYENEPVPHQTTLDMGAVFDEAFEKAAALAEQAGVTLRYTSLSKAVYGLADEEKIHRAVYNLVSNSLKFTPKGGFIDARLTLHGSRLHLTVQDSGTGIPSELRSSVYTRYQREPCVEDGRHGIGLGMIMIRTAAIAHGGTVLLEQPNGQGARFTVTFAVRQSPTGTLHAPLPTIDYAGGRDHGLLELSDVLPASAYEV